MKIYSSAFLLSIIIIEFNSKVSGSDNKIDQSASTAVATSKTSVIDAISPPLKVRRRRKKVLKKRLRPSQSEASTPFNRDSRFFSIFTTVRFRNDACLTTSGNNGTCYTPSECVNNGGVGEGSCASGFG